MSEAIKYQSVPHERSTRKRSNVAAAKPCRVCHGTGVCSCPIAVVEGKVRCYARFWEPSIGDRDVGLGHWRWHGGRSCHNCLGTGIGPRPGGGRLTATSVFRRLGREVIAAWIAQHGPWCPGYGRASHQVDAEQLTVDHVLPLVRKGKPYEEVNLAVLCRSCNSRKGSRIWALDKGKPTQSGLTLDEAAFVLGASRQSVISQVRAGDLPVDVPSAGLRPRSTRWRIQPAALRAQALGREALGRLDVLLGGWKHACAAECTEDLHATWLVSGFGWVSRDGAQRTIRRALDKPGLFVERVSRVDEQAPADALPLIEGLPDDRFPPSSWLAIWRDHDTLGWLPNGST